MSVESHMPSSDYNHPKRDEVKKDTRPEGVQDEVCSSTDDGAAAAERDRLSGLVRSAIHSPPSSAIAAVAAASAVTPPPHVSQPLQLISLIQQIKMRLESFTNDNSDPMEDDL